MFNNYDRQFLLNGFNEYSIEHLQRQNSTVARYSRALEIYIDKYILNKIESGDYLSIYDKNILEKANNEISNNFLRPSLLNLLDFLHSENFIENDNTYREIKFHIESLFIQDSRPTKKNNEFFTPNEIRNLFSDSMEFKDDKERYTAPLIVALSFFCLYKQSEIFKLKITDIDMDNKTIRNIRFNEDSNLTEYIKMNTQFYTILHRYLTYRNSLNVTSDSLIIINQKAAYENSNSINNLLGAYKRKENSALLNYKLVHMDILMRSMILYTLQREDINGLAKILMLQKENEYLKSVLNEYIDIKKASLYFENISLLSVDELIPKSIVSNITDNYEIQPYLEADVSNETNYLNMTVIPYSIENDINSTDLEDYPLDNKYNLNESKVNIQRLVRDSSIARKLKLLYDYECQLCGFKLPKADGGFSIEAHHIQPYNKTHLGDDTSLNLIVLCPNCHAQFDDFYFAIHPQTLEVHCLNNKDDYHLYNIEFKHVLGEKYLDYAWKIFSEKYKLYQTQKAALSFN